MDKFNNQVKMNKRNNDFPERPEFCMKQGCLDEKENKPHKAALILYLMRDKYGKVKALPFTGDKDYQSAGYYNKDGPHFCDDMKFEGFVARCAKCYYDDLASRGLNHMATHKFKQIENEKSDLQKIADQTREHKEYAGGL